MSGLVLRQKVDVTAPALAPRLQRKCACGGASSPTGECEECRRKRLQRKLAPSSSRAGNHVPPSVHRVLAEPGTSLDATIRAQMEQRFGFEFSGVRVHADAEAARSAQEVHAQAYTVGRHVVFASGRYAPQSFEGRALLAHELTHVVQQGAQTVHRSDTLAIAPHDKHEAQAECAAHAASRGDPVLGASQNRMDLQRASEEFSSTTSTADDLCAGWFSDHESRVSMRTNGPILARQAAPQLHPPRVPRPPPPHPVSRHPLHVVPGEREAAREFARRAVARRAVTSAERAGWRQFWRVVIRRFALRGMAAVAVAAADGPLPIGDLISLGLAVWTVWEIIQLWDVLWAEAQQAAPTSAEEQSQAAPQVPEEENRRRSRCFAENPGAQICEEPVAGSADDRDEVVAEFIDGQARSGRSLSFSDLGDSYEIGSRVGPGVIQDCGYAPAIRFHYRINGISDEVSIFGCLCCDRAGQAHWQWSRPHWSDNQSRRTVQ
jgi:hypothetical protein